MKIVGLSVSQLTYKPLTETWLSHDDEAEVNVLVAGGYKLCHLPRKNRRGGGVGVLFKSTLRKISETHLTTDTFEGLSIVWVYVIYRPPSSSMSSAFLDDIGLVLTAAAPSFVGTSMYTMPTHNQRLQVTLLIY